jgi:hypothetical protein
MLRRTGPPLLLALVGLAAGVAVARLPPDLETSVVTRRHHGADPLLSAVLLRFGVESLLHQPARYFRPPILHPDPNPLRGTEPLLAEALLAVPVRLGLGDRPAAVYTCVKIVTLALLSLATSLLLRELGVRLSLCLLAGGLSVMIGTTAVFVDRLQAVSLQWLPLALLAAIRYWRGGRLLHLVLFAVSLFLAVQASLYTTVMLLAAVPFLAPLLRPLLRAPAARLRAPALAAAGLLAAAACLLVLRSWAADRADVAAYSSVAYASEKSWNPSTLVDLLTSPPEYGPGRYRIAPEPGWDGVYPGTAFGLLLAWALVLTARGLADPRAGDAVRAGAASASKPVLTLLLGLLAATLGASLAFGASGPARLLAAVLMWAALATWWLRLLRWPTPEDAEALLRLWASAAFLAAFVLWLLSLGSPIRLHIYGEPLAEGLFRPLSSVLQPLRELRELKRCLLPAGWAVVLGTMLVLEQRLRARRSAAGPVLAAVLLLVGLGERLEADTRKASLPPVPEAYALLRHSQGRGGLLELPLHEWGRIFSVHRMLWQPAHGRPIVAGKTGLDPGWYAPALGVLNEFPSDESLLLLRAWGIGSVLDGRGGGEPAWPEGVELRGRAPGARGEWRLLDIAAGGGAGESLAEPGIPDGSWERPRPPLAGDPGAATLASDGSLDSAAEVAGPDGLSVLAPEGRVVTAVELDYGSGRFGRVPSRLRVEGRDGGAWLDLTEASSGQLLRARAAHQLLLRHQARLVVRLRPRGVRELRLSAPDAVWDLPELRLRLAPADASGSGS